MLLVLFFSIYYIEILLFLEKSTPTYTVLQKLADEDLRLATDMEKIHQLFKQVYEGNDKIKGLEKLCIATPYPYAQSAYKGIATALVLKQNLLLKQINIYKIKLSTRNYSWASQKFPRKNPPSCLGVQALQIFKNKALLIVKNDIYPSGSEIYIENKKLYWRFSHPAVLPLM